MTSSVCFSTTEWSRGPLLSVVSLAGPYQHDLEPSRITTYLQNGGTIEHAQQIANHESPRTTKLYDRTNDAISRDEIERILI
jgi:hypothetical protein